MKNNKPVRIISLILSLAIVVVIFLFSAQEGDASNKVSMSFAALLAGDIDFTYFFHAMVRHGAHMTEYAALSVCLYSLLLTFGEGKKYPTFANLAFCILYAVSDELHQYFVPGRSCNIRDLIIDSTGVILGMIFIQIVLRIVNKQKEKKKERGR